MLFRSPSPSLGSTPSPLPPFLPRSPLCPCSSAGGLARILLAPDTAPVRHLADTLSRALACSPDPAQRVCIPPVPNTFYCLFRRAGSSGTDPPPPEACGDYASCVVTPACYSHVLEQGRVRLVASEEQALEEVAVAPHKYDAVLAFQVWCDSTC